MTTRERIRVGVLLVILLLIFLASGYRAEATTATIEGEHVCLDTGEWQIVWTVYNDDDRPMTVTGQEPPLWPPTIPGKTIAVAQPYRIPGDSLGASADLYGYWSDPEQIHLVGIIDLREETCSTTTTTTTVATSTSTTAPSSTTSSSTTIPSEATTTSTPAPDSSVPTTTVPTQLPFTGTSDWLVPLAVMAFGVLVLGVLAIRASR